MAVLDRFAEKMKYLDLLGVHLKDDLLNDLFETKSVDVIYSYDRTNDNLSDRYRAEIPDLGLQFVFDENQVFYTLFMRPVETSTFNPFQEDHERLKRFNSKREAIEYATDNSVQTSEGKAEFMGEERDWIRFECEGYSIHYEYVDSNLSLITIQVGNA